jgi:acetolactate synthase I/II/III large subunit
MNGAHALLRTLVDSGVEVCFGNPGTSEMQVVAALDQVPAMRAVLALFEGVATGAADGYGRMTGRPAAVLLHLGPGLANGLANLHNARRAATPIVALVGDHATYHQEYDAPLQSDIDAVAGWASGWVRHATSAETVAGDAAAAVAAACAPPGRTATLVLPADVAWTDGAEPAKPEPVPAAPPVPPAAVDAAAAALRSGEQAVLLIGGAATRAAGRVAAARIAAATGARVLCETFPARLERGAGLPPIDRVQYFAEVATEQLAGNRHAVLAGTRAPVSFFAYPGKPSTMLPAGCATLTLAAPGDDVVGALEALAEAVGAPAGAPVQEPARPGLPAGPLTPQTFAEVVGALLPERAIVVDEANTAGAGLPWTTAGAPRHDWLTLTGGAIGQGLPVAVGAAVACPDRPVLALQADGSAMYTISALWTMAREDLDVTVVVLNNRAYAILQVEMRRVGVTEPGPAAAAQLTLDRPDLDFVALARGMGVPAVRADTAPELAAAIRRALAEPGPHLIDAVLQPWPLG